MIPIRQNSFFEIFNKTKNEECMEIIKSFIALNLNTKKAYAYLKEEKYLKISLKQLRNIYNKIRESIYYYYL